MEISIKSSQLAEISAYPSTKGLKGRIHSYYSFSSPEYYHYLKLRESEDDFLIYNGSMLSIREFYQFILYFMFKHSIPFGSKINRIDKNDTDKFGNNRGLRTIKTILCLDKVDGTVERQIGYYPDNSRFVLDSNDDICVYVGGNLASDNKVFASLFNELREQENISGYTLHYENDADGKIFIQGQADFSDSLGKDNDKQIEMRGREDNLSVPSAKGKMTEIKPCGQNVAKERLDSVKHEQTDRKLEDFSETVSQVRRLKTSTQKEERRKSDNGSSSRVHLKRPSSAIHMEQGHVKTIPYRACYEIGDYYYSYGYSDLGESKTDICRMNLKTGEINRLITIDIGIREQAADEGLTGLIGLPLMDIYENKIYYVYHKDGNGYEMYIGCMNLDGSDVRVLPKKMSRLRGLICGESGIVAESFIGGDRGRQFCLISYEGNVISKVSSSKRVVSAYESKLVFESGSMVDLATMEKSMVSKEYPSVKGKRLAMIDLANEMVYYYEKAIDRFDRNGFEEFWFSGNVLDNELVGVNKIGEEVDRWDISLIADYRKTDLSDKDVYDRCTYAFNGQRLTQKLSVQGSNNDSIKPTIYEYDRYGQKTILWKDRPDGRRTLEAFHYMEGDTITFLVQTWEDENEYGAVYVSVLTNEGKVYYFKKYF